jgi:glc operon protein GlcG
MNTRPSLKLTHAGALRMLQAAVAHAEAVGVAQNITIVDEGGNLMAFARMDGAKLLSIDTSRQKAISAASHRQPTARLDPGLELKFAAATGGRLTNLEGGLPIIIDGEPVGGIGVGSGTGAQDIEVATAGLKAVGAQTEF